MEQDKTTPRDADNDDSSVTSASPPEISSKTCKEEVRVGDKEREVKDHDTTTSQATDITVAGSPRVQHEHEIETDTQEQLEEVETNVTANGNWDPLRGSTKELPAENDADPQAIRDGSMAQPTEQEFMEKGEEEPSARPPTTKAPHLYLELKSAMPPPQSWDPNGPLPTIVQTKLEYSESTSAVQPKSAANSRSLKPKSSYYFGPPPEDSAFGTAPVGQIGVHHPREMIRIERDYSGGELPQFAAIYPLELQGRISPTQFLESINSINEILISAYSLRHGFIDNAITVLSLQLSRLFLKTHYEKEMGRLHEKIGELNELVFNPVGLNVLWPRNVAFLFLEIEYY
ncbi:hypothetical protein AGABI2DRAFT_190055 [Agaricus bisporus var. bisporus H97]|uniref:hypothetical protein n=1 Tax=Agaricus bisporus var. bisporus (strain H97 / ATCC MYA-4626 / FGSC 10389) TaxID=936046 RepID=UPI00029F7DAA|nr:hypothetical protein AGABI2DRAFT_190055 [Agaricus bisporus var. bisporus H97]EKV51843.1 hypothetical protein AGABI2DRAFT_190055 [Agaricus bisporus var. bisporus H97]